MSGLNPGYVFGTSRSENAPLGNSGYGAGGYGSPVPLGCPPLLPGFVFYTLEGEPSPIPYDGSQICATILLGADYQPGEANYGCAQASTLLLTMEGAEASQGTVNSRVYVQRKGSTDAIWLFGDFYNNTAETQEEDYNDVLSCMGDRYFLVISYGLSGNPENYDFYYSSLTFTPGAVLGRKPECYNSIQTSHCSPGGIWTP